MTTAAPCPSCGTEPRDNARFCDGCGCPIAVDRAHAEYKQVTVLFADVVHSMDIAATVGAERLREIMAELFNRSSAVVKRYGGTVDKFTGDGIMAVFGAPVALEDHALRACLAALDIQQGAQRLAEEVADHDGVALRLRIGLNSGQVIAGEIGSGPLSYTAVGEQVGMAQRMESVAPAGGVMLSESTARLVQDAVVLGDHELHQIKGAGSPVRARRLLAIDEHQPRRRSESTLVGRTRELSFLTAFLDEALAGAGSVVNIVGPAGIGKSRLAREIAALATRRGVAVFTTYCESHTSEVPFHAIARLFSTGIGIDHLDDAADRARVHDRFPDADDEDLRLLDDLLGIADTGVESADIAPDARRRRLTALINAAALVQTKPALYLIEDVHWIDEASESMLAQFLSVIPQTPSLVLITSRPEYHGALSRVSGAQTVALRPLSAAQGSTLATELLGADPSLVDVAVQVSARAAGNPFFAEEMVRDLAERGVLTGAPGAFSLGGDVRDVDVPATVQATIGARIDRLDVAAKHTLNAAAVIGSRFDQDLLTAALDTVHVSPLIEAELVDQVRFGRREEYAFRHPLIRAVAYESQLKSGRAELHRRLAAAIEARDPSSPDENAALIAEHFEAAGDPHAAFNWHLRAGTWLANRDIAAARGSWRRARQVADDLPDDDPERASMRIAPRALLCGSAHRLGGGADTGFDELRELCTASGDLRSLAIGLNGLAAVNLFAARRLEASRLADELIALLESIDDPALTIALSLSAATVKHESGEMLEVLRLTQRIIDLADDDPRQDALFSESPVAIALALRGDARWCLGIAGWKEDLHKATTIARASDPLTRQAAAHYRFALPIPYGISLPDAIAMRETAETLASAEHSADDMHVFLAQMTRGITLVHYGGPHREVGLQMLANMRDRAVTERFCLLAVPHADIPMAQERARIGDLDGAVQLSRALLDGLYESGGSIWCAQATTVLVEALIQRSGDGDLDDAQSVMDRLAAVPADPGFVLHDITLLRLRALLARARGDEEGYRDLRDRYRATANDLGFEGHMAWAEAMA